MNCPEERPAAALGCHEARRTRRGLHITPALCSSEVSHCHAPPVLALPCLLLTRPVLLLLPPLPVLARCFGLDRWDGERRSHAEVAAELQQPIEYVTRTEVRALRKLRGRRGLSDLLEARGLMR